LIGFVGASGDYVVTSSYFLDTQPGTRGTALSYAAMRLEQSFVGWDFPAVWKFDLALSPYPSLAFE
jgi:hypothetical protein